MRDPPFGVYLKQALVRHHVDLGTNLRRDVIRPLKPGLELTQRRGSMTCADRRRPQVGDVPSPMKIEQVLRPSAPGPDWRASTASTVELALRALGVAEYVVFADAAPANPILAVDLHPFPGGAAIGVVHAPRHLPNARGALDRLDPQAVGPRRGFARCGLLRRVVELRERGIPEAFLMLI